MTFHNRLQEDSQLRDLIEVYRGLELLREAEGDKWRVRVITSGTSKNLTHYPKQLLEKAAKLYHGVQVFYSGETGHPDQHRGLENLAGYITNPEYIETDGVGAIEADFEVNTGRPGLRDTLLQGWKMFQRTGRLPFGLSHVVNAGDFDAHETQIHGQNVTVIDAIRTIASTDLVMNPSAGGELLGLAEAVAQKETTLDLQALLERIRNGVTLTEDEWTFVFDNAESSVLAEAMAARPSAISDPDPDPDPEADPVSSIEALAEDYERRLQAAHGRLLLTESLAASTLPESWQDAIREDATHEGAPPLTEESLSARIERDQGLYARTLDRAGLTLPNSGAIEVTSDQRDRYQLSMDAFFAVGTDEVIKDSAGVIVQPFQSIKEAYLEITGQRAAISYLDPDLGRDILNDMAHVHDFRYARPGLRESISLSTFTQIFGDSITRRLMASYQLPSLQTWRQLVGEANIVPVRDFRTQRRMRIGGFGDLPVVAERGTYQPLTTPGDEEATWAASKRGGTEDISFESITNDDVSALRRVPIEMGLSAAHTLYTAIWVTTIANNAQTTYDTTDLFHADHGNLGSTALSEATINSGIQAMRNQTRYGDASKFLGMTAAPVCLAVPNELENTAWRLNTSSVAISTAADDTEPNWHQGRFREVFVIDDWTDANNWFMFSDPNMIPFLEVGFLGGRQEPELFVQDQPTSGTVFTADVVTYKIRHIWGVGILDHRGAYGAVVT